MHTQILIPIPKSEWISPILQSALELDWAYNKHITLHYYYYYLYQLPGDRDNARNNNRCTQARKTMHGLDGQHQDMDRTPCGRVNQNDRGQG